MWKNVLIYLALMAAATFYPQDRAAFTGELHFPSNWTVRAEREGVRDPRFSEISSLNIFEDLSAVSTYRYHPIDSAIYFGAMILRVVRLAYRFFRACVSIFALPVTHDLTAVRGWAILTAITFVKIGTAFAGIFSPHRVAKCEVWLNRFLPDSDTHDYDKINVDKECPYLDEALQMLGFEAADRPDIASVDRAFRQKSLLYSPDKGGTIEGFRQLKHAQNLVKFWSTCGHPDPAHFDPRS